MKEIIIITKPSSKKWKSNKYIKIGNIKVHDPGLAVELSNDKSLVEIFHFYYVNGKPEVTEGPCMIGAKTENELDLLIDALNKIKTKLT
jgi:hypothetical protein